MDVNKLSSVEMLSNYRTYNSRLVGSMNRLSTGERASEAKDDPILWGEVEELKQFATILTGFSDNLNRAAASVRIALDSMDLARSHLAQAKEKLNQAFAEKPESLDRAKALEDYNEFLGLIDDSAEAPDAGARRLLDSPANFPDAGDINVSAGENSYFITLHSREIHTGANGLDIPRAGSARPSELEADPLAPPTIADINNATNDEIKEMLAFVERASESLVGKVKALSVDAAGVEDSERFNAVFVARNRSISESINVPNLKAEAILAQSLRIKTALSINGLSGSISTYKMALQLLR